MHYARHEYEGLGYCYETVPAWYLIMRFFKIVIHGKNRGLHFNRYYYAVYTYIKNKSILTWNDIWSISIC
jgi:hypothetical protein